MQNIILPKPNIEFNLYVIKANENSPYVLLTEPRDKEGYNTNGEPFMMRDETKYFNGWNKLLYKIKFGESLITNDYKNIKEV